MCIAKTDRHWRHWCLWASRPWPIVSFPSLFSTAYLPRRYCYMAQPSLAEQAALQEANLRVKLATESGGIGIWDLYVLNNTLTCDPFVFSLHGVTVEDDENATGNDSHRPGGERPWNRNGSFKRAVA